MELKTGGRNSLKLAACEFDRIGEYLFADDVACSAKDAKWLPVAAVRYAIYTASLPKLAWCAKQGDP
jgi:hypothetical protein